MKKTIIMLFVLSTGLLSCTEEKKDFEALIEDRIWVGERKNQVYYSADDKTMYIYWAFEKRKDGTYTPYIKAKGTPKTNPMPKLTRDNINKYEKYREGWHALYNYKIKDNILLRQDTDDLNGSTLEEYELRIGKDTTIGVFDYNTVILTQGSKKEKFIAKK